jgi:hypothetical protein
MDTDYRMEGNFERKEADGAANRNCFGWSILRNRGKCEGRFCVYENEAAILFPGCCDGGVGRLFSTGVRLAWEEAREGGCAAGGAATGGDGGGGE